MSFMQPQVWEAYYYEIDTTAGTVFVEANNVGLKATIDDVGDYLEPGARIYGKENYYEQRPAHALARRYRGLVERATSLRKVKKYEKKADRLEEEYGFEDVPVPLELKYGYLCWLHAPGYLDNTGITAFDTEIEALEHLLEMYGNDGGEPEDWEAEVEERVKELRGVEA